MENNFIIDQFVEEITLKNKISSFYPIHVSKTLNIPLNTVVKRLNYLVDGGELILKYEIRCTEDLTLLKTVESYSTFLGKYIDCYSCNDEIKVNLENIFPVYFINLEYRKVVKKKSLSIQEKYSKGFSAVRTSEPPQNIISSIKNITGIKEEQHFKNIERVDSSLSVAASIACMSGDKEIVEKIEKIDDELKDENKHNIVGKILTGSENIGKLKDGAEGLSVLREAVASGGSFLIAKWPEISSFVHGLFQN